MKASKKITPNLRMPLTRLSPNRNAGRAASASPRTACAAWRELALVNVRATTTTISPTTSPMTTIKMAVASSPPLDSTLVVSRIWRSAFVVLPPIMTTAICIKPRGMYVNSGKIIKVRK